MTYTDIRFADIQMLRYRLNGFESLPLRQKELIYCLSQATLAGRDITFSQFGSYNLKIRRLLEFIFQSDDTDRSGSDFDGMAEYLRRLWFSNGIYHHYGCQKFEPKFTKSWLHTELAKAALSGGLLPLYGLTTAEEVERELFPVIFDKDVLPRRVAQRSGGVQDHGHTLAKQALSRQNEDDIVTASAVTFYGYGVTANEATDFYDRQKATRGPEVCSIGLNTRLVKTDGKLHEEVCSSCGLYRKEIQDIVFWLERAAEVAETESQRKVIEALIGFYRTGRAEDFDRYCIEWVGQTDSSTDFINGFIETYNDPLGIKGSWEGIVHYKDEEACRRTETISSHAAWFEAHSPVDPRFRKKEVKGVTASVVIAAQLGGDEYPATAIGINLPNADHIRARYGSKSITISNITDAYNKAAHGNGLREEFIPDSQVREMAERYADITDTLHTDLHECLGHGSGQLLEGVSPDALRQWASTVEEARADLFALYFLADAKLVELGLLPDANAYQSGYYLYLLGGLLTQLARIEPGHAIEEAHMQNRALIARWTLAHTDAARLVLRDGKTQLEVTDYQRLRQTFATLLAEVQRIKSEGDYAAASSLVVRYGTEVDPELHSEVLSRYHKLDIAPYKGFINPVLTLVRNASGQMVDIAVSYSESYDSQMLRYGSTDYSLERVSGIVKDIKKRLRLVMDGTTAASQRAKGANYGLNWGASLPSLKAMAAEYGYDYNLAMALWREDIRECRILATMIMPPQEMSEDVAMQWMEQMPTAEIAEIASFSLFRHLPYAARVALKWTTSGKPLPQTAGFHTMAALMREGYAPDCAVTDEFLLQCADALRSPELCVRRAATAALNRFAELSPESQKRADETLAGLSGEV